MKTKMLLLLLLLSLLTLAPKPSEVKALQGNGVYQHSLQSDGLNLNIEILADDLAHFEIAFIEDATQAIWTSPMVAKTDYAGPTQLNVINETTLETAEMRLEIDPIALCVTVTDISRSAEYNLTTICPRLHEDKIAGLSFTPENTTDVYGLGQYFQRRGDINDNLFGQRRMMLNNYGNELTGFNGGNVGNTQIPVFYALGSDLENYALFLDNIHWQYWSFSRDLFSVETLNLPVRWYIMTGADLPDLRQDYMELTGRPPVPPKQMFGLWVSEYGYDDWAELEGVLTSLQAASFPLDGFILDLQWFGNITPKPESQMGSLTWDESKFPNPEAFIADLRQDYGLGVMLVEEPYVSESARNYDETLAADVLVQTCGEEDCPPIVLDAWWGKGGMLDWTNPDAAAWWHDERRQALVEDGIIGHWTDLGEPENYAENAWYYGFPELNLHSHADVHNVYNLFWSQSIWEGYQRNAVEQRPFIMSRSGTAGSQRYGVGMWSGDIAANMVSLSAHLNVQANMSLSGIDYFGADIGGFYRQAADPILDADALYTVWLANAVLLDVPLRPHAQNLQNSYQTAPSLIGDTASNLANIRLRYTLSPYLYSLAHQAYRTGEAIFPPPVYYFQADPNTRELASQKMLGAGLMMATLTGYNTEMTTVYLPAGQWFNYHDQTLIESSGEWIEQALNTTEVLQAPLFARAGAIIPQMPVDAETLNSLGQRRDGTVEQDLILRIYGGAAGEFSLIEDDGTTIAYQDGQIRETHIAHAPTDTGWQISLTPSGAAYPNEAFERAIQLQFIAPPFTTSEISVNGEILPQLDSSAAFDVQGWYQLDGQFYIQLGKLSPAASVQIDIVSQ